MLYTLNATPSQIQSNYGTGNILTNTGTFPCFITDTGTAADGDLQVLPGDTITLKTDRILYGYSPSGTTVTVTDNAAVTSSTHVNITGPVDIGQVELAPGSTVGISGTPTVELSGTPTVNIGGTNTVQLAPGTAVAVSGPVSVSDTVTVTGNVNATLPANTQVAISGDVTINDTTPLNVQLPPTTEVVVQSGNVSISGTPVVSIGETVTVQGIVKTQNSSSPTVLQQILIPPAAGATTTIGSFNYVETIDNVGDYATLFINVAPTEPSPFGTEKPTVAGWNFSGGALTVTAQFTDTGITVIQSDDVTMGMSFAFQVPVQGNTLQIKIVASYDQNKNSAPAYPTIPNISLSVIGSHENIRSVDRRLFSTSLSGGNNSSINLSNYTSLTRNSSIRKSLTSDSGNFAVYYLTNIGNTNLQITYAVNTYYGAGSVAFDLYIISNRSLVLLQTNTLNPVANGPAISGLFTLPSAEAWYIIIIRNTTAIGSGFYQYMIGASQEYL